MTSEQRALTLGVWDERERPTVTVLNPGKPGHVHREKIEGGIGRCECGLVRDYRGREQMRAVVRKVNKWRRK
jgi:hypothetical protein